MSKPSYTIEEYSALNILLNFTSLKSLILAASRGFVDKEEPTEQEKELSDLCWKLSKTIR